jgi:hypothetical protein
MGTRSVLTQLCGIRSIRSMELDRESSPAPSPHAGVGATGRFQFSGRTLLICAALVSFLMVAVQRFSLLGRKPAPRPNNREFWKIVPKIL